MRAIAAILLLCIPMAGAAAQSFSPPPGEVAKVGNPGWTADPRTGCWVWNPNPMEGETVKWSGGCDQTHRASGEGTLEWGSPGAPAVFTGVLKGGKANGHGVSTGSNGVKTEGDYVDWVLSGQAKISYSDGAVFEGEVQKGQRIHGRLRTAKGAVFEGDFADNRPSQGNVVYENGNRYVGTLGEGGKTGNGDFIWTDGSRYSGMWANDMRNGQGTLTWPDGTIYQGNWFNDAMSGQGSMMWKDGNRYTGNWVGDHPEGYGEALISGERVSGNWVSGCLRQPNGRVSAVTRQNAECQ